MSASLGHVIPAVDRRRGRYVEELALNVDLMLEGNGAERMDTLLHEMARQGAKRGLATMCIGVGQGISMLVEAA